MQTIDEMARVLTEVDPSKVSFTKQQRNYINMRGGNRTVEDGV